MDRFPIKIRILLFFSMNFMDNFNKYSLSVEFRSSNYYFFFMAKKFNFEEKNSHFNLN